MLSFETLWEQAVAHKGSVQAVEERLPQALSAKQLGAIADDRWLATMTKGIFQAGFVWRVIEAKWPGFEAAFARFDPATLAFWPPENIEALMSDTRVIRNLQKLSTVPLNANFVRLTAAEHGGFGRFIGGWPDTDITGLWAYLARHGARLGGNTGPYFLRRMGKDTFLLSRDVVTALHAQQLIQGKNPGTKANLARISAAFNAWRKESGRTLGEISMTLALSVG